MAKTLFKKSKTKKTNYHSLKFSKQRSSSGQAQALWTFFVVVAVAVVALMRLSSNQQVYAGEEAIEASSSAPKLIPNTDIEAKSEL